MIREKKIIGRQQGSSPTSRLLRLSTKIQGRHTKKHTMRLQALFLLFVAFTLFESWSKNSTAAVVWIKSGQAVYGPPCGTPNIDALCCPGRARIPHIDRANPRARPFLEEDQLALSTHNETYKTRTARTNTPRIAGGGGRRRARLPI